MNHTKKITLAAMFCALAVAGSLLSFPFFGSKCAPVQHIVNIVCAVTLGPFYGVAVAFVASLLRNLLGLGSLLAFPGSMCGALLCGVAFHKTRNLPLTLLAEVIGTALLGGLASYPLAIAFMGQDAATLGIFAYVIPFLISTGVGACLSVLVVLPLQKVMRAHTPTER